MGQVIASVRRRMKNYGKSRKLTKSVVKTGWGVVVENKIPKAGCKECKDGYIRVYNDNGYRYKNKICSCLVEWESLKYSRKLLEESNIPERPKKFFRLGNWEENDGMDFELLKSIIESEGEEENWLFLYGNAGTGKTYASIILAQIAIMKEMSVYFVNVTNLLDLLRPNMQDESQPQKVMKQCEKVDVLILDDIGHEKSSQWVRERLYRIINDRWNSGKITVFTSNFNIEHLKDTVSPAVYSRVKGESLEVEMKSQIDKRLK